MGLKKRNKTSAEFSMSSLTDIIFLLLIFFMLTANFVRIDPYELPKSDAKTIAPTDIAVSISKDGKYSLNGKKMPLTNLKGALRIEVAKSENKANATISVAAEVGTPFSRVVEVMNVAKALKLRVILLTQAKE
ncbi:MAG: biopolymer transporter ExbD [Bacteroidota bacterium]